MRRSYAKKIADAAMLTASALIFSYVESLIPITAGIPGIKLGLANLIVLTGIYFLPYTEVLFLLITRILLSSFLFGNLFSLFYSLSGGILSFLSMLLFKQLKGFTVTGVSIIGGISHNIGQLICASLVLKTLHIMYYAPVLILSGAVAGTLIGLTGSKCLTILRKYRS